ncbi:WD repeat-containing protein 6 [Gryganskiella cystojenkinii]|nr:WD repeat-containing protein 6 [Gryganskiella cystojenkinii]
MATDKLRMHPAHLTTPVTALAYHDNEILLSGQGPYMKATLISTSETLTCIHLGGDWKVHRIVLANVQNFSATSEGRLLMVFGAKSLRIMRLCVTRNNNMDRPRVYFQHLWNVVHMKDWIVDAQWLWPKEELQGEFPTTRSSLRTAMKTPPTSVALGYAHNFVEVFDLPQDPFTIPQEENQLLIKDDLSKFRLTYTVQSEEHCTVFCGRFHNNTLEDLWFASGTVFCHALLWKVYHRNGIEAPVVKSLVGHEGILFGIRWSDDGKAVCTVSDDRTIRIWDITNPDTITHSTHFGHSARVWDCQIVGQYLISISEDASCRVWRNPLLGKVSDKEDMSDCLACWEGHEGKSAWSVAISDHGVVATGGGDGGIHLWRLDSIVAGSTDVEQYTKDVDLPEITTYFPDAFANEKEFVRDYAIISETESVYATNTGYILIRNDTQETWRTIYQSDILRNYASLEASTCGRIAVAGCLAGKLVIVSMRDEFENMVVDTIGGIKIQFVFVMAGTREDDFRIAVFRANCTVAVFQLKISTSSRTVSCRHLCELQLPNNNKAIHAAYFSPRYNMTLLGSRDGTLLVYNLNELEDNAESMVTQTLESIIQLRKCHGSESVSSILMVTEEGEGSEGKDRINVYSTGRDGSWTRYRFLGLPGGESIGSSSDEDEEDDEKNNDEGSGMDDDQVNGEEDIPAFAALEPRSRESTPGDNEGGTDIVLQKIFRSKITKGWLEQIFIMDGELLFLGFFNKKLFVYNESKHFEIFSMHSGAANRRRWRFLTNNARLEHTKLMFYSGYKIRSFSRQLTAGSGLFQSAKLQNNFHGREVRHLRFLNEASPLVEGAPAPIIFASGGEDCRLRLFQYIPYKTRTSCTALRPLCNLKPHLGAALRCLEWSSTDVPHSYLLFTGGAIESLRAWQVTLSIPNSYQVQQIEDHDGNMIPETTPLSLGCLERAQCPHVSENLETRIMDLSVFTLPDQPRMHFIASVYSDAAIRVWCFDEVANSFILAVDASYHEKCILQVTHVRIESGIMMLTAATDGKIAIWDLTRPLESFLNQYNIRANKSSVQQPIRSYSGKNKAKVSKEYAQGLEAGPLAEIVVHQSGVNSLSARNVGRGIVMTASGGDDNALVVSQIQASWETERRAIKVHTTRVIARDSYAHGSAIQAVSVINDREIVTTSQDQMISLWSVEPTENGGVNLCKSESQFVHVPDPSTMDVLPSVDGLDHTVAIAGIGIQTFNIQHQ